MSRVSLVSREDLPEEYQPFLAEANMGDLEGVPNIFRTLGQNPPILRSYVLWSKTLWDEFGGGPRTRELLILAVARATSSRYVWNQHVPVATNAGVTPTEIKALGRSSSDPFVGGDEALIEYATAFIDRSVDERHHRRVLDHFDEPTVVGVAALCSNYLATAAITEGLAIDLENEFVGWDLARFHDG